MDGQEDLLQVFIVQSYTASEAMNSTFYTLIMDLLNVTPRNESSIGSYHSKPNN